MQSRVRLASSGKKRVLIVDDAVVVRKTLSDAIGGDPALEVVGTAGNGRIALAKFPALKPDVILLDVEMPEMDGLETVRELRKIDSERPHHYVQYAHRTRRGGDPGSSLPGSFGLRHQAKHDRRHGHSADHLV